MVVREQMSKTSGSHCEKGGGVVSGNRPMSKVDCCGNQATAARGMLKIRDGL